MTVGGIRVVVRIVNEASGGGTLVMCFDSKTGDVEVYPQIGGGEVVPDGSYRRILAADLISFAAAVAAAGWTFGPVQWVGSLTGSALAVVAIVAYRPTWLRIAALAALPLAAATVPLALLG